MYVSAPRRRRAGPPIPIRVRRHANSPIFAGRSPVPWSPAQPTPPSGRSADFQPFPVSPESTTTTTDSDGDLSPSCFTPPVQTPWPAGTSLEHERAGAEAGDGSGSDRRESVESRTGGVPETPTSTPVDRPLLAGIAMTMRMDRPDEVVAVAPSKFAGLPRSPRWRGGGGRRGLRRMPKLEGRILELRLSDEMFDEGGTFGRVIKIADEAEASGVEKAVSLEKGDDRGYDKVIEGESEAKEVWQLKTESAEREKEVTGMEECRCQKRRGFEEPIRWRKCPWVALMLVLFMLFIPTWKDMR